MVALERVLVATDFGDAAAMALTYARELARTFRASLSVVHVVEDVASRALVTAGATPEQVVRAQAELEADARQRLDAVVTDADRADLAATTIVKASPTPASAIVACARELQANLLVIGTHGRGPVTHLLLGNVAERVVRTAPCPVLTIRHPEHEFVHPDAAAATLRTAGGTT